MDWQRYRFNDSLVDDILFYLLLAVGLMSALLLFIMIWVPK